MLIESVISFAMLSILIGVLTPGTMTMREQAHYCRDPNNTTQIDDAFLAYRGLQQQRPKRSDDLIDRYLDAVEVVKPPASPSLVCRHSLRW